MKTEILITYKPAVEESAMSGQETLREERVHEGGEGLIKITSFNGTIAYTDPETEVLHRTNGPAHILPSGIKNWWKKGKRHRIDGPAIESPNGSDIQFLIEDELLTAEEIYIMGVLKHCPKEEVPLYVRFERLSELIKKRLKEG